MYNPERFKSTNQDEAFELMDRFPFATLIAVNEGKPFVSHLPLTPMRRDGKVELIGHMARANPHWKILTGGLVTAIFHGPHTYITPVWYTENDVPTWSYVTAHVTGRAELIEDERGIVDCLQVLSEHAERHWPSGWELYIPEDLRGELLTKSIVGFRIQVEQVNFKKKLGQNRSEADRLGVLQGLEERKDENSQLILNEMKKLL